MSKAPASASVFRRTWSSRWAAGSGSKALSARAAYFGSSCRWPTATADEAAGGHRTVLSVEDNPANLRLIESITGRSPGPESLIAPSAELVLDRAYDGAGCCTVGSGVAVADRSTVFAVADLLGTLLLKPLEREPDAVSACLRRAGCPGAAPR